VLYIRGGRPVYEYVYSRDLRQQLVSDLLVPAGASRLQLRFDRTGDYEGTVSLWLNGQPAGSLHLPKTWPVSGLTGGLYCGRDGGSPVSTDYVAPFAFTGTIHTVTVDLDGQLADAEVQAQAAMTEE